MWEQIRELSQQIIILVIYILVRLPREFQKQREITTVVNNETSFFTLSGRRVPRHYFICPDWPSEETTYRRYAQQSTSPMKHGWI